ncbi:MAG: DUF5675 family protein, partial [Bacteroidota bacterium]
EGTATSTASEQGNKKTTTVYERIDSGTLGSEVYLVVETANLRGKKVDIEIFDQEKLLAEDDETAIKVIRDDQETDWINAVKIDDTGKAIVKVKLRKKSDEDYKKQRETLKDDKQAMLFLKVTCQGDDKKHKKVFLKPIEEDQYIHPIAFGEHFKLICGDPYTFYITRESEVWRGDNESSMTLGKFRFGNMEGYIIEPYGPETTERGKDKRVPVGAYNITWHNQGSYPKNVYTKNGRHGKNQKLNLDDFQELNYGVIKLYNDNLPTDRAILMHAGSHGGWTKGCILVNKEIDKTKRKLFKINDSVKTLYEVIERIEEIGIKNIKIIIEDEIN